MKVKVRKHSNINLCFDLKISHSLASPTPAWMMAHAHYLCQNISSDPASRTQCLKSYVTQLPRSTVRRSTTIGFGNLALRILTCTTSAGCEECTKTEYSPPPGLTLPRWRFVVAMIVWVEEEATLRNLKSPTARTWTMTEQDIPMAVGSCHLRCIEEDNPSLSGESNNRARMSTPVKHSAPRSRTDIHPDHNLQASVQQSVPQAALTGSESFTWSQRHGDSQFTC
jgi:hypothetical protein